MSEIRPKNGDYKEALEEMAVAVDMLIAHLNGSSFISESDARRQATMAMGLVEEIGDDTVIMDIDIATVR